MSMLAMALDYDKVIDDVTALIGISKGLKNNPCPGKSSGVLTLFSEGEYFCIPVSVDKISSEKYSKYNAFSIEKGFRVMAHYLRTLHCKNSVEVVSSYQTRNPELNMWGGAVLFGRASGKSVYEPRVISFSGLCEHADEAVSYTFGKELGWVADSSLVDKVVATSDNSLIYDMISQFEKNKK